VGDVGRGVAADFDLNYRGCEMFSTMANLYNCKGNVIYSPMAGRDDLVGQ
jgi:rhamnogalacturonan endolyase